MDDSKVWIAAEPSLWTSDVGRGTAVAEDDLAVELLLARYERLADVYMRRDNENPETRRVNGQLDS